MYMMKYIPQAEGSFANFYCHDLGSWCFSHEQNNLEGPWVSLSAVYPLCLHPALTAQKGVGCQGWLWTRYTSCCPTAFS